MADEGRGWGGERKGDDGDGGGGEGEGRGRNGQAGVTRERAGAEAGRDVRLRAESHGAPQTGLQKQAWATNMELFVARGVPDADQVGKATKPKAAVVPRAATLEWMLKLENALRVGAGISLGQFIPADDRGAEDPLTPGEEDPGAFVGCFDQKGEQWTAAYFLNGVTLTLGPDVV